MDYADIRKMLEDLGIPPDALDSLFSPESTRTAVESPGYQAGEAARQEGQARYNYAREHTMSPLVPAAIMMGGAALGGALGGGPAAVPTAAAGPSAGAGAAAASGGAGAGAGLAEIALPASAVPITGPAIAGIPEGMIAPASGAELAAVGPPNSGGISGLLGKLFNKDGGGLLGNFMSFGGGNPGAGLLSSEPGQNAALMQAMAELQRKREAARMDDERRRAELLANLGGLQWHRTF